jgi:tetratricopeptide (TPR) repeat protein
VRTFSVLISNSVGLICQKAKQKLPFSHGGFFLCLLLIATILVAGCSKSSSPADILAAARQALRQSKLQEVGELVRSIPPTADEWQAGQLLAGEAAAKNGKLDVAQQHYIAAAAKDSSSHDGQLALFSLAEVYLEKCELSDAEPIYRSILEAQPGNGITNQRMAFLLAMTGRRWEGLNHYFILIKGGEADYRELGLAADVSRSIEQPEFLEKCRLRCPQDKLVRLAVATHAFDNGAPQARALLKALIKTAPEQLSAQSMLGELLIDGAMESDFLEWHESLPPAADASPDIWFVRGLWARKQGDLKTAADCFWQTVIRMPFHRRAFYMLGQVLVSLDDDRAGDIVRYSELLILLSQSVDQVLFSEGRNQVAIQATAKTLEKLGRTWEACAWAVFARNQFPSAEWHAELLSRHSGRLTRDLARIEPDKKPVLNTKTSDVPLFSKLIAEATSRQQSVEHVGKTEAPQSEIRFEATELIAFEYYNGEDPETKGARTFEQTGGGVAILDLDMDGVPDVFLPQGSEWPTGEASPGLSLKYVDRLFRNMAGQKFLDVSQNLAGLDSGFGQGCSVGDFNNDGFPDLYVANVGRNCLYENMGDGTFLNVTTAAEIKDESWTVSCMICDLNADGLPDIFDVNYLTGDAVYEKICNGRACSPAVFQGAPDRLLINQGAGQFAEVIDATPRGDSRGMGVVAFETQANRRPSLFVSNDQVANFFLDNQPANNPYNIHLENRAITSGLAYNDDGLAMACMGIATEDWDNNGLLDLFVTNFHNEANTLYRQDAPGLFVEATKTTGLLAASISFVGWGTQFLDADLDGRSDLVVANGHLDDYRDEGGEFHMRPQFFRNLGDSFQELSVERVGPWFGQKHLGRGLAKVDWNSDGLPEFIVSNMNSPLGLLKNTSRNPGHFLRFKLYATRTARDAIGARVMLKTDSQSVTKQLTAGDGLMASNERVVEFGLGASDRVREVTIHWPSGATSTLVSPRVDCSLIFVENIPHATRTDMLGVTSLPVASITEEEP